MEAGEGRSGRYPMLVYDRIYMIFWYIQPQAKDN
jgi:hypothetical protein